MGKYFIDETTVTAIADAVRELEGSTEPMAGSEMAGKIQNVCSELSADLTQQESLIDQISAELNELTGAALPIAEGVSF